MSETAGLSSAPRETPPRDTPQRRAIREALEEAARPLSPAELLEVAQQDVPGLGIATVYRNLKTLLHEGWIAPVDLPGDATRYEISGKPHHHHFVCRRCDQAFEVDSCPGNFSPLVPEGFLLEDHEMVFYGVCRACR